MKLEQTGWERVASGISPETLESLRREAFFDGSPGTRCLLDTPIVASTAARLKARLIESGLLSAAAVAIQAIAFNKTASTNWKVAWHQDLMFPFARPVQAAGYDLPTRKQGVDHARPPVPVLENLLAARLHLDPCCRENGPLRVSPGTHKGGIIPSGDAAAHAIRNGEILCLADEGDVILMKPLTLHASRAATVPGNRRVLHMVFHSGEALPEPWHRSL